MTDLHTQLRDYGRQIETDPMLATKTPRTVDVESRPPRPRLERGPAWALAAFALVLTVGGLYIAFSGGDGQVVDQTTIPTPTTVASVGEIVYGWPDTMENPAGLYSWDGARCAGESCTHGLMHNGNGSGDVEIRFNVAGPQLPTYDDATAVTVAGYPGIYRRIDEFDMEKWIVDIDGRMIDISVTAEPGTSQADLDEAHSIIDSIRAEPSDNNLGFRLVFTLTTSDWDSG